MSTVDHSIILRGPTDKYIGLVIVRFCSKVDGNCFYCIWQAESLNTQMDRRMLPSALSPCFAKGME